jgi:ferritin
VEEEKTSSEIVETLRMIGDNSSGLYMFDKELGGRGAAE